MRQFQSAVVIARPVTDVMEGFWRLETWPNITRHVKRVEIHFEDDNVQVLSMHVDTRGKRDVFKSVRIRQGDTIHYFQPTPPPTLKYHQGRWVFAPITAGTEVTCEHSIVVDPVSCMHFFKTIGSDLLAQDAAFGLEELIRNNSNQTMEAMKHHLEAFPLAEAIAS